MLRITETLISSNDSRAEGIEGRPSTRENLKQNQTWTIMPKDLGVVLPKPHSHCVILDILPTEFSAMFICKTKVVVPCWPSPQGCNKCLTRYCKSDTVTCCSMLIRFLSEQWIRTAELLISSRASQSAFPDFWILVILQATQGWGRQGEESKPQGLTLEVGSDVIVASFLHMEPGCLVWASCL